MKSDPVAWAETFETNVSSQFFVAAGFLLLLAKSRDNTPGFSSSMYIEDVIVYPTIL
jgi:hypothetical protein